MRALSLNEIAATVGKAARGGGLSWGIAEETGSAARWLAARGLFAPAAFAEVLEERARLSPPLSRGEFAPRAGFAALCPLCLGALLCDCAEDIAAGDAAAMANNVAQPLLAAAFLHPAARTLKTGFALSWRGGGVVVFASSATVRGDVFADFAGTVRISVIPPPLSPPIKDGGGDCCLKDGDGRDAGSPGWRRLIKLAAKTMVPSTKQSRVRGAGAGLTDND